MDSTKFGPWFVDFETSDDTFLFVDVDAVSIVLKRTDEGLKVLIYDLIPHDNPLAELNFNMQDHTPEHFTKDYD